MMRVDLWLADADARPLDAFRYRATASALGGGTAHVRCEHTPVHYRRTAELMRDGLDDVFLTSTTRGTVLRHAGGDTIVPPGGIALLSKARLHEGITPRGGVSTCIQAPRAALTRLLPALEEAPLRVFVPGAPGTPQAALALGYGGLLAQGNLPPAALRGAVAHLHELMAGALDPGHDTCLPPEREAADAPRLALIQHSIRARLGDAALSLEAIARLHHTTPRQVQRLFARQDSSFSGFLREARMQRARALLTDPREGRRRVLEIALDCGFDDIPAFSRAFRRRFGMTPSEARHES
jgi:AraC-like DNA-binding protein